MIPPAEHKDPPSISRWPLRHDVMRILLNRIVRGQLVAGRRINEPQLADELGVSRTPLREALVQLQHAGLVESRLGKGFLVTPLSSQDIREIYPIVAELEILAVRSTPVSDLIAVIPALEELAEAMAEMGEDPADAQRLDSQWHSTLIGGCPNRRLLAMVDNLKLIAVRYEYAFMSDLQRVRASAGQHLTIVAALQSGRLDDAVDLLRRNWNQTTAEMLVMMEGARVV